MTLGKPISRDLPLILHDLIDEIDRCRIRAAPQAEVDRLVVEYRALRPGL